jgi:hypothetical protein
VRRATRLFAERAEADLRATGETARKRDPSTLDDLRPGAANRQACERGAHNREIAAQLFLEPDALLIDTVAGERLRDTCAQLHRLARGPTVFLTSSTPGDGFTPI